MKVTIDRELLEHMRNFTVMHDSGVAGVLRGQIDAILANPAQQGEAVEVVAWVTPEKDRVITTLTVAAAREDGGAMLSSVRPYSVPCMTVAQHQRILAASVPAGCKVVPVKLLKRLAGNNCDPDCCIAYWRDELRALLASAEGGRSDRDSHDHTPSA